MSLRSTLIEWLVLKYGKIRALSTVLGKYSGYQSADYISEICKIMTLIL